MLVFVASLQNWRRLVPFGAVVLVQTVNSVSIVGSLPNSDEKLVHRQVHNQPTYLLVKHAYTLAIQRNALPIGWVVKAKHLCWFDPRYINIISYTYIISSQEYMHVGWQLLTT